MSIGALALHADQTDWNDVQRAALAQIGIERAPRGDQLVFMHVAQRMGLDPFNREIYMIGRKDEPPPGNLKWTIQIGIDGFRSKSEEHPQYGGIDDAEWCGPDGIWTNVWLSDQPPAAARFTVYRRDWDKPCRAVAMWREYAQYKAHDVLTKMWQTRSAGQLAKCAEALARRKAFPRILGGVYIQEELDHLDNPKPIVVHSERADQQPEPSEPDWDGLITQNAGDHIKLWELRGLAKGLRPNDGALLNKIAEAWQSAKKRAEPPAAPAPKQPAVSKTRMNRLTALLAESGLTTTENRLELIGRILDREVPDFNALTAADVEELIRRLGELKGRLNTAAQLRQENPPADDQAEQHDDMRREGTS